MILKVFAVRDVKASAFLQPFYSPSVGSALRAFGDAVADTNCPFNKHPEDYVLYEIGIYDDSSAELAPNEVIKMMATASDFVNDKVKVLPGVTKECADMVIDPALINGKK